MPRFYLPPGQSGGETLLLDGREAHHALQVLRLRPGEGVTILDGRGARLECEIAACGRDHLRLRVNERHWEPAPAAPLTLLQGIPKGKTFEFIIQKAAELGASRVVPLLTDRVALRLGEEDDGARKRDKWEAVADEAIKQCGSCWLPEILAPQRPADYLARGPRAELSLLASLQAGSAHPRLTFTEFRAAHGRPPQSVDVWVGPEGDFTPEEITAILAGGARPITLGNRVLRAETAACYCLSVLGYELAAPSAGSALETAPPSAAGG